MCVCACVCVTKKKINQEFLDLIRTSTAEHPPILPSSAEGGDAGRHRHEQLMSYHAARALTRKIIRAQMPSPMEHVLAYASMPSSFRPSMLAGYVRREEFFPSSMLNPVLAPCGLHYEQMQLYPIRGALRQTPLHSATGTPVALYHSYHVELEFASGIPLPADLAHRGDIVARRVRVCLLSGGLAQHAVPVHGGGGQAAASAAVAGTGGGGGGGSLGGSSRVTPLSNLYMAKAEWSAAEEDRWRFDLRFKESDANAFVLKTDARECTILFELTCLVKKQGAPVEKKGSVPPDGRESSSDGGSSNGPSQA